MQRIENLSLNELTANERQDFENYVQMIQNHETPIEIKEWVPWWRNYEEEDEHGFVSNFSNLYIDEISNPQDQERLNELLDDNLNNYVMYDQGENN